MIPNQTEVRQIFNEAYYLFYKKWINPNTPFDADIMMQEARELNQKYDCDLCRHMVADLIECIEYERKGNQSE